jgi:hypothetical protein
MPTHDPARQKVVSTVASLEYWTPDSPRLPALRAELAAMKCAEFLVKTLAGAPPLNPEQRSRLVAAIYGELDRGD